MFTSALRTLKLAPIAWLVLASVAGAADKAFELYPGATAYAPPETEANKQFSQSLRPGTKITAYLSNDSLEKVLAFYKRLGKEFTPRNVIDDKLPNGQHLRKKFVILDGASNLLASREWVSVQHPFFGSVLRVQGKPEYHDVRDVTEIVLTEKEEVKKDAQKPQAVGQKP